jgi:hypothetical protein
MIEVDFPGEKLSILSRGVSQVETYKVIDGTLHQRVDVRKGRCTLSLGESQRGIA